MSKKEANPIAGMHDDHRERVRQRFLREGLDGFAPHNVLELLLFFSIPRGDTNPVAHRLITRFGSVAGVLDASYHDLLQVEGIGPRSALLLTLLRGLCRYYLSEETRIGALLDSTEKIGAFVRPLFVGRTNETLFVICLDNSRRVLQTELIAEGTVNAVPLLVRRVVELAVRLQAASVILAHNHDRGFALPSGGDLQTTRLVSNALRPLEIALIDHIIVAQGDFVSMRDSALLDS